MRVHLCAVSLFIFLSGVSCLSIQEAGQFFNSRQFGGSVSVAENGDSFVITSNGLPDHAIQIISADVPTPRNNVLSVPKKPNIAEFTGCLPSGPVGMTRTGAMIFNPLGLQGQNVVEGAAAEPVDSCKGQVNSLGMYLYRQNPVGCLYNGREDEFLGVAFDGFPIYGPLASDLGREVTNADLDNCHGRIVNGEYRYHANNEFPYFLGCFKGDMPRKMDVLSGCNDTSEYDQQWGYLCACQRRDVQRPVGFMPPRVNAISQGSGQGMLGFPGQMQGMPGQSIRIQGQFRNRMPLTAEDIILLRQQEIQRLQQLRNQIPGAVSQLPGQVPVVTPTNGQIQRQTQLGNIRETEQGQFVQGPFGRRLSPEVISAGLPGFTGGSVTAGGEPQGPLSSGNVNPETSRDGMVQGPFGRRIPPNEITAGLPGFNGGANTVLVDGEPQQPLTSGNINSKISRDGMVQGPFGRRIPPNEISAGLPGFNGGANTVMIDGEPQQPVSSGNINPETSQDGMVQGPFGRRIDPNAVSAGLPGFRGGSGFGINDGKIQKPLSSGNIGSKTPQDGMVQGPFGERIDPNVAVAGLPGFEGGASTITVNGEIQRPLSSSNIGSVEQNDGFIQGPFGRITDPNVVSAGLPGFNARTLMVNGVPQRPLSSGISPNMNRLPQGPLVRRIPIRINGNIQRPLVSGVPGQLLPTAGQTSPVMAPPLSEGGFQNGRPPVVFLNGNNGKVQPGMPVSPVVGPPPLGSGIRGPPPPVPKPSPPPATNEQPSQRILESPFNGAKPQWNPDVEQEFPGRSGFSLRGLRERPNSGKNPSDNGPYHEYKWFNLYL